ncbi:LysE family translocator [Bacillus pumilus]|uniref:LysE family translocator n=1 Tax=Bacillus pumilus TaxID=1408 RepID=UPI0011A18F35|nr:LysE family translocator [Bacillus pumilus]
MAVFFGYIFLGLSLSAPVGPVNAAQIDRGIKSGFWHAWIFGVGAMAADIVYMLLIYFGVAQLLTAPLVKTFLWLFGFFVLTYTGIESLRKINLQESPKKDGGNTSIGQSFMTGFFISLSNPLSILFWLGIYGSILANTIEKYGASQMLMYSMAIFIGMLIWDFSMALLASSFRRYLSERVLHGLSVLAGLSLLGFGAYFGYQGIMALIG